MVTSKLCRIGIFLTVTTVSLKAETIRIHVEDGRNGKPITDEQLQIWINGRVGNALTLKPGPDGIATLDAPAGATLEIESNYYKDCRPFKKGAPRPIYSVDEIKNDGVVAQNTCGKLRPEAKRGELLFFVKPVNGWEGMKR
jgi:hypothetical protein